MTTLRTFHPNYFPTIISERALEAQVDQVAVTNAATQLLTTIAPGSEGTTANGSDPLLVARSSLESIKGAEQVMAAIELVAQEVELEKEAAATGNNTNKRKIKPSSSNPLLLGYHTSITLKSSTKTLSP